MGSNTPIVLIRKPLGPLSVAQACLAHGTGALDIESARVPGGWPANLILQHTDACTDVCTSTCPVADLDSQGRGKVSRFYLCVRSEAEVWEYLHRLLGTSREAGRVIPQFEPPQAATLFAEMKAGEYAAVVPGTCENTSVLEQAGFEIRDVIHWVGVAGRIYHEPKVGKAERNAGCESLATAGRFSRLRTDPEVVCLTEEIPAGQEALFEVQPGGEYGNPHPALKPRRLHARLAQELPAEVLILDPFAGSGSSALGALDSGHRYLGIEQNPAYVAVAEARVKHHSKEGS